MNKDDVVKEIVEKRKQRVRELNLDKDLFYLVYDTSIRHWKYWLEHHVNDEWWETLHQSRFNLISYDESTTKDNFTLYNFNIDDFKFSYGEQNLSHWRCISSDDYVSTYVGTIILVVDGETKLQIEIKDEIDEFGSHRQISDIVGFIDGDWVVSFQLLIQRLHKLDELEKIERFSHRDKVKLEKIVNNFSISEEEIQGVNTNSINSDTFTNIQKRDEFLINGTDSEWESLIVVLKESNDVKEIRRLIESVVSQFISDKLEKLDSSNQEQINDLWYLLNNNVFFKLQKYELVSLDFFKKIERIFDNLLDLDFQTNQSLIGKVRRLFDTKSSRSERVKKIKFVTTVYNGIKKSLD